MFPFEDSGSLFPQQAHHLLGRPGEVGLSGLQSLIWMQKAGSRREARSDSLFHFHDKRLT